MAGAVHVGCMGWQEKDWIGPFYPDGTKPGDMLGAYARRFPTVEVDSTFYGRPRESTVIGWRDSVGDGFRFSLKVPREVTHTRAFEDAGQVFGWFVERARTLGPKLGAILLQCPPAFRPTPRNRERLYAFLDEHMPPDVRVALELRHAEWFDDALFEMARAQRFALTAAEGPNASLELAGRILDAQADALDFAYIRLMGTTAFERYDRVQADRSASLARWAQLIDEVRGRVADVFVYISDDYAGYSPGTAKDLIDRLG